MGEATVKIMFIVFNVIFIAFITAIIIFIRQYRIKKKAHLKELETVDLLHKKELLKTQTEIQKETMNYIGREIHDNVGQKLTLSSLYLQQLVLENSNFMINEKINNVNDIINQSLIELRTLSKSLTDDAIKEKSIVELIKLECDKIKQLKKCVVNFKSTLNIKIDSYQIKSVIVRIAQEFIQKSLKHSRCKKIDILLSNTNSTLKIMFNDDGIGFDVNEIFNKSSGLNNIKKRIEMLGGKQEILSSEAGTLLTLKIPISDEI